MERKRESEEEIGALLWYYRELVAMAIAGRSPVVPNWVIGGALLGFCGAVYMHTINQIKTTSGLAGDVEQAAAALEQHQEKQTLPKK